MLKTVEKVLTGKLRKNLKAETARFNAHPSAICSFQRGIFKDPFNDSCSEFGKTIPETPMVAPRYN